MPKIITIPEHPLQHGAVLHDAPVAVETWGRLNARGDNALVVCHALTGSPDVAAWWGGLLGPGRAFDPERYFVVCCGIPGSPYGTASPLTTDPATGQPYGMAFPRVTIRDTVALHRRVLEQLGVRQVAAAVGGSLGGMQVLEWAFERTGDGQPFVRALAPIAVGRRHAAWQIGWSAAQREAIYADPKWNGGAYDPADPPAAGLAAARMMAMVAYRSHGSFAARFGRDAASETAGTADFAIESYLRHHGQKLVGRFDAACYVRLTQQMDTHDVARGRGAYPGALRQVTQPALVVGIGTDVLYPLAEQQELAAHLPNARLEVLDSPHGHDAFLIEQERLNALLTSWLRAQNVSRSSTQPASTPRPWWHTRRTELLDVAKAHAPVYVYDEATLRDRATRLRALPSVDRAFYAMKANPNPEVLRVFADAGLGFECVSPGEVQRVQEALPALLPGRILFTPNFAPRGEYAFGLREGVHVTLDNLHPLEAWPDLFGGHDLLLRVDPGEGRGHHAHVRTAGTQSKFGIVPERLADARRLAEAAGARIVGLHAHLGSGIVAARTWARTARQLAAWTEAFPDVRVLNVGGGLGVAARLGEAPLDLGAVDEHLRAFRAAHPDYELWMEPGRFLVAEAGVLLARVTQRKRKTDDVEYVGVETGMNSLVRPALYGAYHEIANLTRLGEPPATTAEVVGPICESGDVLGHGRRLPATAEGDVLLVATAGAYGHAMRMSYNLRPPATEHLLPSNGATEERRNQGYR